MELEGSMLKAQTLLENFFKITLNHLPMNKKSQNCRGSSGIDFDNVC